MQLTIETNFSLKTPGQIRLRSTREELRVIVYMAVQSTDNMKRKSIGCGIQSPSDCDDKDPRSVVKEHSGEA